MAPRRIHTHTRMYVPPRHSDLQLGASRVSLSFSSEAGEETTRGSGKVQV